MQTALGVTGRGVRACVADAGLDTGHPDIAPVYKGGIDLIEGDSDPDVGASSNSHGTHVAGTVAGALTNTGVRGVAPGADLYHARVLAENGNGSTSDLIAGVQHLVFARRCGVVNMSLGSPTPSTVEQEFFASLAARDVVLVAASGNDGATSPNYPAAYPEVISVGAVDAANQVGSFSNRHADLELAAPGVQVLSSVPPGYDRLAEVTAGDTYDSASIDLAGTTDGISARLVHADDGNQAADFPAAVEGAIALIRRGGDTFAAKVQRAMDAGALAAVIYNQEAGGLTGSLIAATSPSGAAWIPVVGVSDTVGAELVAFSATTANATGVNATKDWILDSGTSLAAPHVTGAAALVRAADPGLSPAEVRTRLAQTALDLGSAGRDNLYGFGLVQASAAVAAGCTVTGTAASETLDGTPGDDVICGFGGNDVLRGFRGDDVLRGGDGIDVLQGGTGTDTLRGDLDNDELDGGPNADLLRGGPGSDLADYATRTAAVTATIGGARDGEAGEGDDIATDVERLRGGAGDDSLSGANVADRLYGGPGADSLFGRGGSDVLYGEAGDDKLDGGTGGDVLSGGGGQLDLVAYRSRTAAVQVTIGSGADDGAGGEGDDVRADVEQVQGGSAGDTLLGNSAANRLYGGPGPDDITGGTGSDRLFGEAGADTLRALDGVSFVDRLFCGSEIDAPSVDPQDIAAADCE